MTEIETQRQLDRSDVASYLREFADQLDNDTRRTPVPGSEDAEETHTDGRVTFMIGNDSATVNPPETLAFDVSVGSDSSLVGEGARESVVFDLSWSTEDVEDSDEFRIE